jgi:hypothetical protein
LFCFALLVWLVLGGAWVDSQGIRTRSAVDSQGIRTRSAVDSQGIRTRSAVDSQGICTRSAGDYLMCGTVRKHFP